MKFLRQVLCKETAESPVHWLLTAFPKAGFGSSALLYYISMAGKYQSIPCLQWGACCSLHWLRSASHTRNHVPDGWENKEKLQVLPQHCCRAHTCWGLSCSQRDDAQVSCSSQLLQKNLCLITAFCKMKTSLSWTASGQSLLHLLSLTEESQTSEQPHKIQNSVKCAFQGDFLFPYPCAVPATQPGFYAPRQKIVISFYFKHCPN